MTQLITSPYIEPIRCPILLVSNDNNRPCALEVMAFCDTGSSRSAISREMAKDHGLEIIETDDWVSSYSKNNEVEKRWELKVPLYLAIGNRDGYYNFDVHDLHESIGHALIGRDLMWYFEISLGPLPSIYAKRGSNEDKKEVIIDYDTKKPSVEDTPMETLQDELKRQIVRDKVKELLDEHTSCVSIKDTISHPLAMVSVDHESGTPKSFINQYSTKNPLMLEAVSKQVKEWVEEGRVSLFEELGMGAKWPQNNIPLLPVATFDHQGKLKKIRVCFDCRGINKGLILDATPLANIRSLYERIGTSGNIIFSELDLRGAFMQFPLNPQSREKVTFTWGGKSYVANVAVFGLAHMAQFCSRVLTKIFADHEGVFIYCDNIIIASRNMEEHLRHIQAVIDTCNEYRIRLNPEKCFIAYTKLRTLGNVISAEGLTADPEKVHQIMSWHTPRHAEELSSFLSTVNYLRQFIRHFSQLCAPLNWLRNLSKTDFKNQWLTRQEDAFVAIKRALTIAPMLRHPDWSKKFTIQTDASIGGLGWVLYQPENPRDTPTHETIVMFGSRSLKLYEKHYSVYRLELQGIVFALRECDEYIFDRKFTLLTDHNALVYLLVQKEMNRILLGHFATLAEYMFDIYHISGQSNNPSDGLSRQWYPTVHGVPGRKEPSVTDGMRIIRYPTVQDELIPTDGIRIEKYPTVPATTTKRPSHMDQLMAMTENLNMNSVTTREELLSKHYCDTDISPEELKECKIPVGINKLIIPPKDERMEIITKHHLNAMNTVTRTVVDQDSLVENEKNDLTVKFHRQGHFGVRATLKSLQEAGYSWFGMRGMVEKVCHACVPCQQWAKGKIMHHPTTAIKASQPWERIQIDLGTSLGPSVDLDNPMREGDTPYRYVLVVYDVFTTYTHLFALRSKEAEEISDILYDLFARIGPPKIVQSDNEKAFVSEVFKNMITRYGCEPFLTPAYKPSVNGGVERMVQTSSDVIRKFTAENHCAWHKQVNTAQIALNNLFKVQIGMTPFEMFYGRKMNAFDAYKDIESIEATADDIITWQKTCTDRFENMFPATCLRRNEIKADWTLRGDKKHRITKVLLPVGTAVMTKDVVRNTKNDPPWIGPYRIVRAQLPGLYTLMDTAGTIFYRDVPLEHLKRLGGVDISNSSGHTVEMITDHRDRVTDGGLIREYNVLWMDKSQTWESREALDDTTIYTDYVKATRKRQAELPHDDTTRCVWEIESILDHAQELVDGKLITTYLVKWKNYSITEATWEDANSFEDSSYLESYAKRVYERPRTQKIKKARIAKVSDESDHIEPQLTMEEHQPLSMGDEPNGPTSMKRVSTKTVRFGT